MNKVILKGRVVKQPEIRYGNHGEEAMCFAKFTLAVEDRTWKESDNKFHVDYILVSVMGKLAELVERTVTKGKELVLMGKWRTTSYEKDGKTFYTQYLFLEELEYCGKKTDTPMDFLFIPETDEDLPFK